MSERPEFAGEGLGPIIGRAGEKPLARLSEIKEAERQAGLGFLKAKVDVEGVRATLKSGAEQKQWDNTIAKILAGTEVTKAEAAKIRAQIGDFKAASLTTGDLDIYPISIGSVTSLLEGNIPELTVAMNAAGWRQKGTDNPLTETHVEQILAELTQGGSGGVTNSEAFIDVATRAKEIYINSRGQISRNDSTTQAVREFLLAGGGEHDAPPFLKRLGLGPSTSGASVSTR